MLANQSLEGGIHRHVHAKATLSLVPSEARRVQPFQSCPLRTCMLGREDSRRGCTACAFPGLLLQDVPWMSILSCYMQHLNVYCSRTQAAQSQAPSTCWQLVSNRKDSGSQWQLSVEAASHLGASSPWITDDRFTRNIEKTRRIRDGDKHISAPPPPPPAFLPRVPMEHSSSGHVSIPFTNCNLTHHLFFRTTPEVQRLFTKIQYFVADQSNCLSPSSKSQSVELWIPVPPNSRGPSQR